MIKIGLKVKLQNTRILKVTEQTESHRQKCSASCNLATDLQDYPSYGFKWGKLLTGYENQ